jgi:hypothetical protein
VDAKVFTFHSRRHILFFSANCDCFLHAEPETHFSLVRLHIKEIRRIPEFAYSHIQVFVERNLGFEAEHFQRNLQDEENVSFYRDFQAGRTGVLTTENVKLGAMTMTNVMLREQRVNLLQIDKLISRDPQEARRRLREQLEIYSLQFKTPENAFQRGRYALSGKVGGFKDDIVICLQLGIYWTESIRLVEASSMS